jgi:hypothetical protein
MKQGLLRMNCWLDLLKIICQLFKMKFEEEMFFPPDFSDFMLKLFVVIEIVSD